MTPNLQMEQRSLAVISAVAADAGVSVVIPRIDDQSVDGVLIGRSGLRPQIEFQVKATVRDIQRGDSLRFPIAVRDYDQLRMQSWAPRILLVVLMPDKSEPWLSQTDDGLCLHSRVYWVSLAGLPSEPNAATVTVSIPTANVFDRVQLEAMMNRAEAGSATEPVSNEAKYRSKLGGIYGVAEAARYLKAAPHAETLYPVTSRTLRGWIRQRCVKADGEEFPVDFDDLIAMRVIAALRSAGVSRSVVNDSELVMREETGQRRPMATETLWGGQGQAFSEWRKCLIGAGRRGQAALDLVQEYLIPAHDLVFDESSGQTVSWEPQPGIVLNPLIQFGAPCIKTTRIPTSSISGMIAAGDSVELTASAYRISPEDVQACCDWESRLESA